jgi:hypothetical protein
MNGRQIVDLINTVLELPEEQQIAFYERYPRLLPFFRRLGQLSVQVLADGELPPSYLQAKSGPEREAAFLDSALQLDKLLRMNTAQIRGMAVRPLDNKE